MEISAYPAWNQAASAVDISGLKSLFIREEVT